MKKKLFLILVVILIIMLLFTFFFKMHPVFFIVIAIIVIYSVIDNLKRKNKLSILARKRRCESLDTFSKSFEGKEISPLIINSVYNGIQEYLNGECKCFPLRSDDDLFKDLGIDEEDFRLDIFVDIAEKCNRNIEQIADNFDFRECNTVKKLILLLHELPQVTV